VPSSVLYGIISHNTRHLYDSAAIFRFLNNVKRQLQLNDGPFAFGVSLSITDSFVYTITSTLISGLYHGFLLLHFLKAYIFRVCNVYENLDGSALHYNKCREILLRFKIYTQVLPTYSD
jgi:hypothetical protein